MFNNGSNMAKILSLLILSALYNSSNGLQCYMCFNQTIINCSEVSTDPPITSTRPSSIRSQTGTSCESACCTSTEVTCPDESSDGRKVSCGSQMIELKTSTIVQYLIKRGCVVNEDNTEGCYKDGWILEFVDPICKDCMTTMMPAPNFAEYYDQVETTRTSCVCSMDHCNDLTYNATLDCFSIATTTTSTAKPIRTTLKEDTSNSMKTTSFAIIYYFICLANIIRSWQF